MLKTELFDTAYSTQCMLLIQVQSTVLRMT